MSKIKEMDRTQIKQDIVNRITIEKIFEKMDNYDMWEQDADSLLIKELFILKRAHVATLDRSLDIEKKDKK